MLDGYIIGKRIGSGSYGSVYLVTCKKTRQVFAMKKICVYNVKQKEKEYIISEILIQKAHKCQYIIKLIDAFYYQGHIYIISEFANNGDLDNLIKKHIKDRKYISDKTIAKWTLQLASALKYLHRNNIIHRDIKTSNIFLDSNWDIKLGDLGISKIMGNDFNLANTYIGTPYYMAPELYEGKKYNTKCDIWSFGCIIYELITLRKPFEGRNLIELANKIKYSKINSRYLRNYKREYLFILDKMLISDYRKRCDINLIYTNSFLEKLADNDYKIKEAYLNKTNKNFGMLPKINLFRNWAFLLDDINRNYHNETIFFKSPREKVKSLDDSVIIDDKPKYPVKETALDDTALLDKYKRLKSPIKYSEYKTPPRNPLERSKSAPNINYNKKEELPPINNKVRAMMFKNIDKPNNNPFRRRTPDKLEPIEKPNLFRNVDNVRRNSRNRRNSRYDRHHLKPINNRPSSKKKDPERCKSNLEFRDYKIDYKPQNYYQKIAQFKQNYVSPYKCQYRDKKYNHIYNSDAIKAVFNYGY